ncbi:Kinesin-like protein KIF15 [Nosema granulosis]|uniref:Kinesin-like protein n=1 Tax=Nosema granulosis TaxID=83296 RepID=A0A9P6KZN2_9MICR|nr:Kinesin-like protein KIF15 [Nosema granulosis]
MGENIKTYLRVKPNTDNPEFTIEGSKIHVGEKGYVFDKIFKDCSQIELFEAVSEDILVCCMQGYNCSLFAYGQTGSGKTYTIQGKPSDYGLVQRCLCFLHNLNLEIKLSFVEIYNENMIDLFDPSKVLNLREDPIKSVVIENLTINNSENFETSMEFYSRGIKTRRTKSTAMNMESSRSHSIFTVYIKNNANNVIKESKLSFVDLAGSERLKDLEVKNIQIKETTGINKSLFCLGKIIHKLSEGDNGHIGYRDSKLTFLLKDSLGGNSKLRVIGNVCLGNKTDTINTMNFLNRLKMINNLTFANTNIETNTVDLESRLKLLDQENQKLKTKLALYENGSKYRNILESNFDQEDIFDLRKLVDVACENLEQIENCYKELLEQDFNFKKTVILKYENLFKDLATIQNKEIDLKKRKKRKIDH